MRGWGPLSGVAVLAGVLAGVLAPGTGVAASTPVGSADQLRTETWQRLPAAPLSKRVGATVVWTDRELIVTGGSRSYAGGSLADGAAYVPATNRWHRIPAVPFTPRSGAATAWTGQALVEWGGVTTTGATSTSRDDGASFDPTRNRWTVIPAGPLPALGGALAVGDAQGEAVILGGSAEGSTIAQNADRVSRLVAAYAPRRKSWRSLDPVPAVPGHTLDYVAASRMGGELVVQAVWSHTTTTGPGSFSISSGTDLFDLDTATGHWQRARSIPGVTLGGADIERLGRLTVIADGGTCPFGASCPAPFTSTFSVLDASGRAERGVPRPPVFQSLGIATATAYVVMTDSQITGSVTVSPGDDAAYDPGTKRWVTLASPARFKPGPEDLVWTDRHLLLWGSGGGFVLR